MRLQRLFFCLLLCSVICCGLFSFSVSAAEVEFDLPKLPSGYTFLQAITYDGSVFKAYCSNYYVENLSDSISCLGSTDLFILDGNHWHLQYSEPYMNIFHNHNGSYLIYSNIFDPDGYNVTFYDLPGIISVDDITGIGVFLFDQINLNNVVIILVIAVTLSVGMVFMWWGVRKISGALIAAFKKSRLKV